jgi:four helix bundle protein
MKPNADAENRTSGLPFARGFWELVVYQKARALQRRVFELSKKFPREEMYSLTDQVRRSARSIGAQVSEAWAKREYEKHFVSKLTDALGECNETQHWTLSAVDDGYLERDDAKELWNLCLEVGRIVSSMSERSDEFCQDTASSSVRESSPEFFCSAPLPWNEED